MCCGVLCVGEYVCISMCIYLDVYYIYIYYAIYPYLPISMSIYIGDEPLEDVFFGLHFDITTEVFGSPLTIELKPGGSELTVTKGNRQEYVDLYVHYVLVESVSTQFDSFKKGFYRVCNNQAMELFQYEELELLVCGNPTLDMKSLKEGSRYEDGYNVDSIVIGYFWEVVLEFNEEEKKRFLRFISGSDRSPIDGLAAMKFVISKSGVSTDPDIDTRLPSAHTCFNHMLLPPYTCVDALRIKLKYAIYHSEGFGLQ